MMTLPNQPGSHLLSKLYFLVYFPMPYFSLGRWLPVIALTVLSISWGYTWVLAKQALIYAPPLRLQPSVALAGHWRYY
jgi:hypothetical protein